VGTQDNGRDVSRTAFYRGDLRWTGDTGTLSFAVTHSESNGTRRERADLIASLNIRRWEFAGGTWGTRGYTSGGQPGMWTSVGVPVGHEFLITVGVDRAPIDWTSEPTWRGTLTIRKRFSLPLPFVGRSPARDQAVAPVESLEEDDVASARSSGRLH
jgi:hypothetical protein